MTKDLSKGITKIEYNSLNLPRLMDIKSPLAEARKEYTYTALGAKLRVVSKWNPNFSTNPVIGSDVVPTTLTKTKTTDYVGNIIYEDNALKRILVDGGYIEGGVYNFYLTDHLGNNRAVAKADASIIQRTQFYPFGAAFADGLSAGLQPYKYNGKELDAEHGVNWYDYSARQKSDFGFTSVDPLAEKYYSISPYVYCANNPINAIDPRGDSIWYTIDNNIATMHFTAKVINKSSNNINVNKLAKSIASGISKAVGNEIAIDGKTYELQTNIQIEGVSSMDDVSSSDHLFAITDHSDYTKYGVTNEIGGKVIHLNESAVDGYFSYNARSAVHEFGHTLGLVHTDPSSLGYNSATDIMTQGGEGAKFTGGNIVNAYENRKAGKLNKGVNSIKTSDGRRIPYPVVKHGNQIGTVFQLGFRYNYK